MPIFEYVCNACGGEFEELVFDREECPSCPQCGSGDTGKLMSAVRSRIGGGSPDVGGGGDTDSAPTSSGSGCAGCTGGNCSSCG